MIVSGVLKQIGKGRWRNGFSLSEFIDIGDERFRKVTYCDYIGSFLNEGEELTLSMSKQGILITSRIWALKKADGEVIVADSPIEAVLNFGFLLMIISVIPSGILSIYLGAKFGSDIGWLTFGVLTIGIPGVCVLNISRKMNALRFALNG